MARGRGRTLPARPRACHSTSRSGGAPGEFRTTFTGVADNLAPLIGTVHF